MKITIVIVGFLVLLVGCFNLGKYLSDYNALAPYGKGFVWGNVILIVAGLLSVLIGLKKKSRTAGHP